MITQLAHVCLGTPNLPASLGFYTGVLGFRTIHEFVNDKGERYGAFLACGGRTFLEIFTDRSAPSDSGRFRHMCFQADDLEALVETLGRAGIAAEIVRGKTDNTLLTEISDPDGNKIEFHQYDQGSTLYQYFSEQT